MNWAALKIAARLGGVLRSQSAQKLYQLRPAPGAGYLAAKGGFKVNDKTIVWAFVNLPGDAKGLLYALFDERGNLLRDGAGLLSGEATFILDGKIVDEAEFYDLMAVDWECVLVCTASAMVLCAVQCVGNPACLIACELLWAAICAEGCDRFP